MKPFVVENGRTFEIHEYFFDADGRRWERTVAGPFATRETAEQEVFGESEFPDPDLCGRNI